MDYFIRFNFLFKIIALFNEAIRKFYGKIRIFLNKSYNFIKENKLITLFLVFVFFRGLYYFDYYYVFNGDFLGTESNAMLIAEGNILEKIRYLDYKRMPLYPTLIATLSFFVGTEFPFLFSAQLLNLFLSVTAILLVYLISYRFLGKAAFFVAFFFFLDRNVVYLTAQPLIGMLLINTILITLYLGMLNSKKSYLTAFLAGITQPDGFPVILAMGIKDFLFSHKKAFFFLTLLSLFGFLMWMMLGLIYKGGSPYVEELVFSAVNIRTMFLRDSVQMVFKTLFPIEYITQSNMQIFLQSIIIIFILLGVFLLLKNFTQQILPMLLFLSFYIFLHSVFPVSVERFVTIIIWLYFLFILFAFKYLLIEILKFGIFRNFPKKLLWVFLAIAFISGLTLFVKYNLNIISEFGQENVFYISLLFFSFLYFSSEFRAANNRKLLMLIPIILLFFSFTSANSVKTIRDFVNSDKYDSAEMRKIGEWYPLHLNYSDTFVLPEAGRAWYYCTKPECKLFRVISSEWIRCNTQQCFVDELKEMDSRNGKYKVYFALPSHIFLYKYDYDYYTQKWYLLENITLEYKDNFKLIDTITIGPNSAAMYEFIS